ncbi:MAG: hypothetical protein ABIR70_11335 [Bryobacteraceae bacterium]
MRISAVLAVVLFPAFLSAQADWRFAHPDATLVGTLRPAAVLNSPLFAAALTGTKGTDPSTAMMASMATSVLSGITGIQFSMLDNGTPEPDMIAMISGRFDDSMLAMLPASETKFRRMDENTMLIGKGAALEKAAARMLQATPVLRPGVLAGTESLAVYDLWISGKVPDLAKTLPASAIVAAGGLSLDFRSVALGLSMHDNVEMELAMEGATPAAAQSLLKSAHEAEAMQPAQFKGMLQSFVDGNTAHFRLNIPREVVLEAMRTPPALSAAAPKPMPAPQSRGTIRIEGLEGGTVTIPIPAQ